MPVKRWWIFATALTVACADPKHPSAMVGRWHDVTPPITVQTDNGPVRTEHLGRDFDLARDGTGTDPMFGRQSYWEVHSDTANAAALCFTERGAVGTGRICTEVIMRGDTLWLPRLLDNLNLETYVRR